VAVLWRVSGILLSVGHRGRALGRGGSAVARSSCAAAPPLARTPSVRSPRPSGPARNGSVGSSSRVARAPVSAPLTQPLSGKRRSRLTGRPAPGVCRVTRAESDSAIEAVAY
jgi:hypothetical protein